MVRLVTSQTHSLPPTTARCTPPPYVPSALPLIFPSRRAAQYVSLGRHSTSVLTYRVGDTGVTRAISARLHREQADGRSGRLRTRSGARRPGRVRGYTNSSSSINTAVVTVVVEAEEQARRCLALGYILILLLLVASPSGTF